MFFIVQFLEVLTGPFCFQLIGHRNDLFNIAVKLEVLEVLQNCDELALHDCLFVSGENSDGDEVGVLHTVGSAEHAIP